MNERSFPEALIDVRFVSEDRRLTLLVRRADPREARSARYPWAVDVGRVGSPTCFLHGAPARFRPREDEDAREASRRLDRLEVELETPSVGPTYTLMLARATDDRSRWHGYDWVALREGTRASEVRLFPEYGGTPFGADDWDWQEGWWYPYSTYRAEDG